MIPHALLDRARHQIECEPISPLPAARPGPCDVQYGDLVLRDERRHAMNRFGHRNPRSVYGNNGLLLPKAAISREFRATGKRCLENDDGSATVLDVLEGARSIAGSWQDHQRVVRRYGAVFGLSSLWTPASARKPCGERRIERRAIDTGLASRHDFHERHRRSAE